MGDHALSFTSADEQITLSHRALNRSVFATGAVRAALWLHGKPPGLYAMQDVLQLLGISHMPAMLDIRD